MLSRRSFLCAFPSHAALCLYGIDGSCKSFSLPTAFCLDAQHRPSNWKAAVILMVVVTASGMNVAYMMIITPCATNFSMIIIHDILKISI